MIGMTKIKVAEKKIKHRYNKNKGCQENKLNIVTCITKSSLT